jgi:chromosome partitioning protein
MQQILYTRRQAAQLLGIDADELARMEAGPRLRGLMSARAQADVLTATELRAVREALGLVPRSLGGQRRQLFLNFKGGTGKTSISTSYAFRLNEMGYRVLLMDLDSQGHSTKCLGYEGADFDRTLYSTLVDKAPLAECIAHTNTPGLDFIPSNLQMATVDIALMPMPAREFRLAKALRAVESQYDFVVMDAPPSFGLLNLNALIASQDLIIPVLPDFLSFHGLKLLFEALETLEDLEHVLDHVYVVINAYNASFKIAKEAKQALETHYGEYLLKTVIRQCSKFAQASSEGQPIFVFDPDSKGAGDIDAMITEVLSHLGGGRGAAK